MAVKKINDGGGLDVAGKKYALDLIIEDNGGKADQSASAAQKLITQNSVVAIIGPNASRYAVPAAEIAESELGSVFGIELESEAPAPAAKPVARPAKAASAQAAPRPPKAAPAAPAKPVAAPAAAPETQKRSFFSFLGVGRKPKQKVSLMEVKGK